MANLSNINNKFLVTTGGNVGIGNTSPDAFLHIGGPPAISAEALIVRGNASGQYAVSIEQDNGSGFGMIIDTDSTDSSDPALKVQNPNGSLLDVRSNGNVGIGTQSPYAFDTTATKLHVKNPGSSGSVVEVARFEGSADADGSGGTIRLGTSNDRGIYFEGGRTGTVPYGKIGTTEYNGAKTLAITLDGSGNATFTGEVTLSAETQYLNFKKASTADVIASIISQTDAGTGGKLRFLTKRNGNTAIDALVIDDNQNVGIGTTNPQGDLHVVGKAGTAGRVYISDVDNGTSGTDSVLAMKLDTHAYYYNRDDGDLYLGTNNVAGQLTIKPTGNVGIGLTGPTAKLHVFEPTSNTGVALKVQSYSWDARLELVNDQGTWEIVNDRTGLGTNGTLAFYNGGYRMALNPAGYLGIGTTDPSRELDIQASSGWAEIALRGNTGGGGSLEFWTNTTKRAEIFADTEDIVFRNTATNQERFRIDSSGGVYNSQSSGSVTKYGYDALNGSSFTGDESSAFGTNALGSSISGRNHAFGFRALQDLTTGGYNTAVGGESIENNIDGSYNTGVGAFALRVLTTASQNTGVGGQALYHSNNNSNTAIGYYAGKGITTGARNVAVGSQAMETTGMTGDDNVAIGHQAMKSLGNSSQNVVIGNYAGDALDTGANNVAVGYKALSNATTQSNNVAIGRTAMQVSSGFNSIAIGNDTLESASGGYNVAIGTFTGRVVSSGVSNVLVGYSSGYDLTTGSYNVCIGDRTGRLLFAGAENTLVGHQTGYNLNGGDYNTCVGFKNLFQASSGQFNTSLGFAALNKYTGDFSVAVGAYALFACTSGARNTAVGYQALFSLNTGIDNTAVGQMALTSVTNGKYNVGVGYLAGSNINSGEFNVAVGRSSLMAVTSGSYNIGIGYDAFQAVSTSGFNTGVGGSVGVYQTGNYNTAMGYFSQYGISGSSSGSYNTSIGYFAGAYNTGENNTFLGALAGRFNKAGSKNTIVGSQAADNADITGSNNTSLGFGSAHNIATAANNVYVGSDSGFLNGSSEGNVGIGYQALYNGQGGGNIAIGRSAMANATTAGSNIAIGYSASGGASMTGTKNISIGDAAGYNITSGSNNILIGANAGRTGSNNPGQLGSVTTLSNEIQMGNTSHSGAYIKISWTVTSDERDKTNIEEIPIGLDFINELKPIKYEFTNNREENTPDGIKRYGFKAQDILELEGESPVIVKNHDPESLKATHEYIIPVLVKAIQELKAEIELLKSK